MDAENINVPNATNATDAASVTPPENDKALGKIYTQAEIEQVIRERLEQEQNKYPSKEELAAYKEWQDKQKTAEQKIADDLAAEKQRADLAQQELNEYKQFDSIRKYNVDESYLEYINYEASKLAKSKNINFDEALTRFMKDKSEKYVKQDTRIVNVDINSKNVNEQPKSPMNFNFMSVRPKKQ